MKKIIMSSLLLSLGSAALQATTTVFLSEPEKAAIKKTFDEVAAGMKDHDYPKVKAGTAENFQIAGYKAPMSRNIVLPEVAQQFPKGTLLVLDSITRYHDTLRVAHTHIKPGKPSAQFIFDKEGKVFEIMLHD